MKQTLVKTERDDAVLIVRLSSPSNRNSLTMDMREQLGNAILEAESDPSIRSVFLTGEGPTFCSGGDLNHLKTACDPWTVHRRFRNLTRWLVPLITLDKPVVIGVSGHAVGGGMGLALTGDVIIASENAMFMSGFFRLGAIPDIAIMYHLPRLIGMARAKKFLFNGESFTAQQAEELGLVSRVVANENIFEEGLSEAKRLAQGPAEVMGLAKIMMARSFETSLNDMMTYEGMGQALAMSNPEFHEGLTSLLNRQPADFLGAAKKNTLSEKRVDE